MGRIFSGKPVKDTETAAESVIFSDMTSSTLKKRNEASVKVTVDSSFQSNIQADDFSEKKSG